MSSGSVYQYNLPVVCGGLTNIIVLSNMKGHEFRFGNEPNVGGDEFVIVTHQ